ncbi:hypothetical protein AAEU76_005105 [Salmonella enterica subsp. enterica serovar Wedding]
MKKAGLAHILFTPQEENLTMRTEPVELLKRADTSKRITIYPHSLNKVIKPEKLYTEEQLNYDIIILLEAMISEVTFNGYIKNDEYLNAAELSVGTTNILKTLNRLIRQKITFSEKSKLTFIKNWLRATNKRTKFIILHIPVLANKQENKYMIHYRENTGTDVHISLPSLLSSMIEANKQKTTHNYMICTEENSIRIKRWDREIFGNETRWRISPPDKFEIPGKLTFTYKVVRN